MTALIGVTGATGAIGGRVARLLAEQGVDQRLIVRDPSRAPAVPRAEVVGGGDYGDPGALAAAFAGVSELFMVSGHEAPDRVALHRNVVDAAVAAGVRRVVYTSFYGAAPECTFTYGRDHWHTEQYLRARGLACTFLRDNFYLDLLPGFAGADGVIRGPAGTGRLSAVARSDVAAVAAAVLTDTAWDGATLELTGPAAFTLAELAVALSASSGRTVSYHDETVAEAYESRAVYRAPDWEVDGWVSTYRAIAAGECAGVSHDIARVLGRPAQSLAEYLADDDRAPG